jgi:hypothetical protein
MCFGLLSRVGGEGGIPHRRPRTVQKHRKKGIPEKAGEGLRPSLCTTYWGSGKAQFERIRGGLGRFGHECIWRGLRKRVDERPVECARSRLTLSGRDGPIAPPPTRVVAGGFSCLFSFEQGSCTISLPKRSNSTCPAISVGRHPGSGIPSTACAARRSSFRRASSNSSTRASEDSRRSRTTDTASPSWRKRLRQRWAATAYFLYRRQARCRRSWKVWPARRASGFIRKRDEPGMMRSRMLRCYLGNRQDLAQPDRPQGRGSGRLYARPPVAADRRRLCDTRPLEHV